MFTSPLSRISTKYVPAPSVRSSCACGLQPGSGVRRWGLEGRGRGHTRWGSAGGEALMSLVLLRTQPGRLQQRRLLGEQRANLRSRRARCRRSGASRDLGLVLPADALGLAGIPARTGAAATFGWPARRVGKVRRRSTPLVASLKAGRFGQQAARRHLETSQNWVTELFSGRLGDVPVPAAPAGGAASRR